MEDKNVVYIESPDFLDNEESFKTWKNRYPQGGAFVLLTEKNKDSVGLIQKTFSDLGIPFTGAVFPELLVNYSFKQTGLIIFLFPVMPSYKLITDLNKNQRNIASSLEEILSLESGSKQTLFLVFDSMVKTISSILENIYEEFADELFYMGVNAGSEGFQPMECLFDNDTLVQDGVLAMTIPDYPGGVVEHGYRVPEKLRLATSTKGNRIMSISLRNAFEVYQEILKDQFNVTLTRDNFYQYSVHFPFGIIRANNEVIVRIPVQLEEDGTLFCVGEVPANETLTVLEASEASSLETIESLKNGLSGERYPYYMLFYCAGRRLHLGERASEELLNLKNALSGSQSYGALSLGEIGTSRKGDYPLFHNAALVLSPWKSL